MPLLLQSKNFSGQFNYSDDDTITEYLITEQPEIE